MGKEFCLLTVIMQLVFECSYHTNVDRLHLKKKKVFLGSLNTVSFFCLTFSTVCPKPGSSACSPFCILHICFGGRRPHWA